jgi:exosome complex component CSL4
MDSGLMLPGQPVPLPRGPAPQLGDGVYMRDGQLRASLVGVPRYEGSVGRVPHRLWCSYFRAT